MTNQDIRFVDGAAYERYMGQWSQRVGHIFLEWLSPAPGRRWLDVGCGNGAFTELIVGRCAPVSVDGVDPSEAQLAHARGRFVPAVARFHLGSAMTLPFADASFDVAVMPLVIFFVPEPQQGVNEMARVVSPGGVVSAYAWDLPGNGMPYEAMLSALRDLGFAPPMPPHPEASSLANLRALWTAAGLTDIRTHTITVERRWHSFDAYWQTVLEAPSAGSTLASMAPDALARLQALLQQRLPMDDTGGITVSARANAVAGRTHAG